MAGGATLDRSVSYPANRLTRSLTACKITLE